MEDLFMGLLRFNSRAGRKDNDKAWPFGRVSVRRVGLEGKTASLPSLRVKPPPRCGRRAGLDGTKSSVSSEITLLHTLIVSSSSSRIISSSESYSVDGMALLLGL